MPQDTPTQGSVAAVPVSADTGAPYCPVEFGQQLDAVLDNAVAATVHRARPRGKLVGRVKLTLRSGDDVRHGERTDRTVDEIGAEIYAMCEANADAECDGSASYRVAIAFAKPPGGRTAAPRTLELTIGQVHESAEATQRFEIVQEVRGMMREIFGQHLALLRQTTSLAGAVGTMAQSLAGAFTAIHAQQREVTAESEVRAMHRVELEGDALRLRTFGDMMKQAMPLIRAKLGLPAEEDPTLPEHVKLARKLAISMRPEQLAIVQRDVPVLGKAATVATDAELLALVADLLRVSEERIKPLADSLSAEQQSLLEQIVTWAANARG